MFLVSQSCWLGGFSHPPIHEVPQTAKWHHESCRSTGNFPPNSNRANRNGTSFRGIFSSPSFCAILFPSFFVCRRFSSVSPVDLGMIRLHSSDHISNNNSNNNSSNSNNNNNSNSNSNHNIQLWCDSMSRRRPRSANKSRAVFNGHRYRVFNNKKKRKENAVTEFSQRVTRTHSSFCCFSFCPHLPLGNFISSRLTEADRVLVDHNWVL